MDHSSSGLITRCLALVGCLLMAPAMAAPTFIVNSTADVVAAAPLDSGPCETAPGNNVCTLRAAIMKANHFPGGGATIRFGLPGAVTHTLGIPKSNSTDDETMGDLNITASMAFVGNGSALTIIDGNGAVTQDRVFLINPGATVTMSGLTIRGGRSSNVAGGILNTGTLTLTDCKVTANLATGINNWGGGIYSAGNLTLLRSVISGNMTGSSNAYGGGIMSDQGTLTITASTISGNSTSGSLGYGGGLYIGGTTKIVNSTISGNSASVGGGIYKVGQPASLINTTLVNNSSNGDGGGIEVASGTLGLFNVTIASNDANADRLGTGVGGGIGNAAGATVNVVNSIIAFNTNIVVSGGSTQFYDDCAGTISSQGSNILYLVNNTHCTVNGAVTTGDPMLDTFGDNGGPTATFSLLEGSPAIDAGTAGGCMDNLGAPIITDQRGASRPWPIGGRCDIGAYEVAPLPSLDIDASSPSTKYDALTDGLLMLRYLFGLTGPSLTSNALGATATRTDPQGIKQFLDVNRQLFDIDGNGNVDALTDGLLIIRYLFGITGVSLVNGAIAPGATRTTSTQVQAYLSTLTP